MDRECECEVVSQLVWYLPFKSVHPVFDAYLIRNATKLGPQQANELILVVEKCIYHRHSLGPLK